MAPSAPAGMVMHHRQKVHTVGTVTHIYQTAYFPPFSVKGSYEPHSGYICAFPALLCVSCAVLNFTARSMGNLPSRYPF